MDFSARRVPFAPIPWRAIAVALLVLALLATALVAVGSRGHVPAPFGPATNGALLYSDGDNIVARDTLDGQPRVVIPGAAAENAQGGNSPDGGWFAWQQLTGSGHAKLMVARADGSDAHPVVNGPLTDDWEVWAPDSRHLAVVNRVSAGPRMLEIVSIDDGTVHAVDLGSLDPSEVQFRPPDGRQLAVRATDAGNRTDIYTVNVDGTDLKELHLSSDGSMGPDHDLSGLAWTIDGQRIAFNVTSTNSAGISHFRIHLVNADGTGEVEIPGPAAAGVNEAWPTLSPDGSQILAQRFLLEPAMGWLSLTPTDLSAPGREIGPKVVAGPGPSAGMRQIWSPDGKTILLYFDDANFYALDPATGRQTKLSWRPAGIPDWRRSAG